MIASLLLDAAPSAISMPQWLAAIVAAALLGLILQSVRSGIGLDKKVALLEARSAHILSAVVDIKTQIEHHDLAVLWAKSKEHEEEIKLLRMRCHDLANEVTALKTRAEAERQRKEN